MNKFLILISLISYSSYACDPVKFLNKGDPSPCNGYIFSVDKELEVRSSLEELKTYKILDQNNQSLLKIKDQEIDVLTQQYKLWQTQSSSLAAELTSNERSSFLKSLGYFALGVVSATAMAFAINHATK